MTQDQPPFYGQSAFRVQPHRGTLILVLGILSLVVCGFLGPFAWVMGNADLKAMAAGRMDRTGESLTQAGRICGMIATILLITGLALACLYFVAMLVFVAAAANQAGVAPG